MRADDISEQGASANMQFEALQPIPPVKYPVTTSCEPVVPAHHSVTPVTRTQTSSETELCRVSVRARLVSGREGQAEWETMRGTDAAEASLTGCGSCESPQQLGVI